ncbi:peptide/nickel transport system substrate-binding protein [Sinosporangium album]|uniref:Peptide/nickel transport system substrate-binding protein n=1 Tax=Sinosporangium album TaxID=504805 RepID=A0A1G7X5K0_9ACTN|nr:ABC transporter substrate-binding protein [Sinosporangium album]SDG79454.1 peptide/nickel transport system substrate-binding protein [Sinosporangium album]
MRKSGAVAAIGALGLLAAACGGGGSADGGKDAGAKDATFTAAIPTDPGALDPATAVLSVTNGTLAQAYDALVHQGPNGVVSGLAEKWEVKPDSVTFTIRKDVTCSDGSTVTPSVIAENFAHLANPETKSPIYGVLVPAGLTAKADDAAGTVTLSTPQPYSFILENARDVWIVCGKGLKDRSILTKQTSGSGPYVLSESVSGDHYTFTRREGYAWGRGGTTNNEPGSPAKIVLKVVPNEQTAANLLTSGGINFAVIQGPDRDRLEKMSGFNNRVIAAGNGQYFYNQKKGLPGADPAVRKALTQAVNLQELGGISTSGKGGKATGLVWESMEPCKDDSVTGSLPPYDTAAATAALDAAGWKPGADGIREKDGKKLSLRYVYVTTRGPGFQAAAEYLAGEWKKIGVELKLNGVIDTKLAEVMNVSGDWDVIWLPIGVGLPSQLTAFLSGPSAPKGANFAHLDNKRYTELVAEAIQKPGPEGCKLWAEAERALFTNHDLVPVVEDTLLLAMKGATVDTYGDIPIATSVRMKSAG